MIFGIISAACCAIFLFLLLKSQKKIKIISPAIIFFALWLLILVFSLLGLYNITRPSSEAYAIILAMIFSFFIGTAIANKINLHAKKQPYGNKKNSKFFIFYGICILVILFEIIDTILVFINLQRGTPMWQIRNWTLEPYGSSNPILSRRTFLEETLRTLICTPTLIILPAVASYYLFHSKNKVRKRNLIILTVITLCLNSVSGGGGRLSFLYLILCLCCSFFAARKFNVIKRKNRNVKKIAIALIISSALVMVTATIARTGVGNLFKQFYTYFALPPTLLSLWLPTLHNTPHTFGLLTTFGIHSYFFRALSMIGLGGLVPNIFNVAMDTMLNAEKFLQVGYGVGNAFVTPIYYFYVDGGIIFTILASLIFGFIVTLITRKVNSNFNIKNFIIYMLIVYGVFISFMRVQTVIPSYIISFLLTCWIFNEKKLNSDHSKIKNFFTNAKLSIILPVYNSQKYIEKCITTLERIKNINYEIIIINDGSSDETFRIAQGLKHKFSNILLINSKKNHGVSHARNLGLKKATGDYITGVDVDDLVSPEMYELLLKNAVMNNADISMCDYYECHGNNKQVSSKYNYRADIITQPDIIKNYLTDKISNNIWDKVIKKELICNLAFNEQLHIGEDILFCLLAFNEANSVCQLPDELIGYLQHSNSTMHTISHKLTEYKLLLKYIPKNLKNKLDKLYPRQYQYFQSELIVRGIHAISLVSSHKNRQEAIKLLSSYYTSNDLLKIIKNKDFSKTIRTEMFILKTFGPKTHLLLLPLYKKIKRITR